MADSGELPKIFAKILVVGDSNVGKTMIVNRFTKENCEADTMPTIGTDFTIKAMKVDGRSVTLQIWDTAGQERYRSMVRVFYRGAQAGVIVFDVTNRTSFNNLNLWFETIRDEVTDVYSTHSPIVIVGNKIDVRDEREVTREEAEEWCRRNGDLLYFETSAKNNFNLEEVFIGTAQEVIKVDNETSESLQVKRNTHKMVNDASHPRRGKCSCQ